VARRERRARGDPLQLRAVRQFNVWDNGDTIEPSSGWASVTVAAKPVQKVTMLGAPAATTTARTAAFTWFITAAEPGDVTSCRLDGDGPAAAEVPCTASGASLSGLSLGAHTLTVYPADGESAFTASAAATAKVTKKKQGAGPAVETAYAQLVRKLLQELPAVRDATVTVTVA